MYRAIKRFHNNQNTTITVAAGDIVRFNDPRRAQAVLDMGLIEPYTGEADTVIEFDPEAKRVPKKADKKQTREV